jgi:TctA family transporter
MISYGNYGIFFTRPIALTLFLLLVLTIVTPMLRTWYRAIIENMIRRERAGL